MGDDITRNSVYSKFERYADARSIANDCYLYRANCCQRFNICLSETKSTGER